MPEDESLFRSLSPLFWFLRILGGTPFHHKRDSPGILVFKWIHSQSFWFFLVTFLHLIFICAQLIWGLFDLSSNNDEEKPVDRFIHTISKASFFIDTFLVSKIICFYKSSLTNFFRKIAVVDGMMSFNSLSRMLKLNGLIIGLNILVAITFWIGALKGILDSHWNCESGWVIFNRIFSCFINYNGLIQSRMLIGQFASFGYLIGQRFDRLFELMNETIAHHPINSDIKQNIIKRPQVHPDLSDDAEPRLEPLAIQEDLRSRSLIARLAYFKIVYLKMIQALTVDLNKAFGLSLLCYLTSKLVGTSISCYILITSIADGAGAMNMFFMATLPGSIELVNIFVTFQVADCVCKKAKGFSQILNNIPTDNLTDTERNELQICIAQTRGEPVTLSACGLFKIGKHLFPSIAGTIATYILVMMQFGASERQANKKPN